MLYTGLKQQIIDCQNLQLIIYESSCKSPLLVMRVWSSVRSGLLFSHEMYFFHISTCWASCGEFWGGTEGAFRSKPFITVSYSWTGLQSHHQHREIITERHDEKKEMQMWLWEISTNSTLFLSSWKNPVAVSHHTLSPVTNSPWRLSWRSCSLCSGLQSSFWPSARLCPL